MAGGVVKPALVIALIYAAIILIGGTVLCAIVAHGQHW